MNNTNDTSPEDVTEVAGVPKPPVSRDDMRQAVVDLLWAEAQIISRIYDRSPVPGAPPVQPAPTAFELMVERPVDGLRRVFLDDSAAMFGITWADVANTCLGEIMDQLYDFAYFAAFDPRYYPHELGDETGAWWVAMFLKEIAGSESLSFQSDLSAGGEQLAAQTLLQIVETANARNLLEGADETFVQDCQTGYLTIRQLALISDFKEESLRVLANPKRKNALPTQSVSGKTVVDVEDARRWLQAKGRYTPVRPKPSLAGALNLAQAKFKTPAGLCEALGDHVNAIATRGSASLPALGEVQALYPKAFWQSAGTNEEMFNVGLALEPEDLQDVPRLRQLAVALGLDPELLVLRAREAELLQGLNGVAEEIRAQTEHR